VLAINLGELGMKLEKANNLITIWDGIKTFGIAKEELLKIGWSKANKLMRAGNHGLNTQELLEIAQKSNYAALVEEIQKRKYSHYVTANGEEPVKDLIIKYAADSVRRQLMGQAIEQAQKSFETEDPAEALALLVHDWMARDGADTELPLKAEIKRLSRKYRADIAVLGYWKEAGDFYTDDDEEEVEAGVI